jgi:nucleoside-diphosphate-sugar epimerase
MKLLITGGNGFLARNLTPLFKQNNYDVLNPPHSELDILNKNSLYLYINKFCPDAILHFAIKGGKRLITDSFEEVYVKNIKMYENIESISDEIPLILVGSGAEFDRRFQINNIDESEIYNRWPIDPYGLSKNIISKRALKRNKTRIIRLFGCFNENEDNTRFIKTIILNTLNNKQIIIENNIMMDFFYLNDVFTILHHILNNNSPNNMNLVYDEKLYLSDIVNITQGIINKEINVQIKSHGEIHYTGSCNNLYSTQIKNGLIGLRSGIASVYKNILYGKNNILH